jgi:hypothetical protein
VTKHPKRRNHLSQRPEAQDWVKHARGILDLDFGGGNDVGMFVNQEPDT